MGDLTVGRITFEQVDRAHRNAKPKPESNPAWANTHRDLGWALREIERLEAEVKRGQNQNAQHVLYQSNLEKANCDLEAEVERLENAIEVMGSTQERYRAALREIAEGESDGMKHGSIWIRAIAKQALKDDSDG